MLITNDPDPVSAFHQQHRRVIYKSTSGVRSITHTLEAEDFERFDCIRLCPTQFQVFVEGASVLVHTVGSTLFATAIYTRRPIPAMRSGKGVTGNCTPSSFPMGWPTAVWGLHKGSN
jgi:hypothetical protein